MTQEAELLVRASQAGAWLEEALRGSADLEQRAALLAGVVRQLWPGAPLYACWLGEPQSPHAAVLDAEGNPKAEWLPLLHRQLHSVVEGDRPAERLVLPKGLQLAGYSLAAEKIAGQERSLGALAVGVPDNASRETQTTLGAVLALLRDQLAQRLLLEATQRELATESRLATLGELARPLSHEFNNFLNVLLLHVAVLEMELPDRLRAELAEVRRQGNGMAAVIRQFQRYRQQQGPAVPVDVNGLVRDAAAAFSGVALELQLAADLPRVPAAVADLKRLCLLLLTNAAAVLAPAAGHVRVRTAAQASQVVLRFEDTGPQVPAEQLEHLFEIQPSVRPGTNALELAACRGLVRRWQGTIRAENRAEGGMAMVVALPTGET